MESNFEIEQMIESFERALEGRPNYPIGLIGLAEVVAGRKQKARAFELCRKAMMAGAGNAEVAARGRRLLSALVPQYHVGMMNDARRNAAWSRALDRRIKPGTRAFEIGTGGGMLALMAARAGAERVTTCERDPILATIAREIAERNGYADRIHVIAKPSMEVVVGKDIDGPVDVLFCDIFGNSLLDFEPLKALTDARRRLTKPDAIVIPAAGSIRVALAQWAGYPVCGHIDRSAGFDIAPFADFVPPSMQLAIGDPGLALRSESVEALRFDFSALTQPADGRTEIILAATDAAVVNGIVHWIRLELDSETFLEARPQAGATFFSSARFWPLPDSLAMRRDQVLCVCLAHEESRLVIWPA